MIEKLPHDEVIEQSVLGTILQHGTAALIEVIGDLEEALFYDGFHQRTFKAILDLFYKSEPIDVKTVTSRLGEDVSELLKESVDVSSLSGYVETLKRYYIRRYIIAIGNDYIFLGYNDDSSTADELVNLATSKLLASTMLDSGGGFKTADSVSRAAKERIETLRDSPGLPGFETGIADFDFLLGGLQSGDLLIIAGRPGSGKTALMIGVASFIARQGNNIGIFSYEMEATKLVDRIAAELSDTALYLLRTAQVPEAKIEPLYSAYDYIAKLPLYIDDCGKGNIGYIIGKSKQLALQGKLDLLCIDYLQLIPGHRAGNRNELIGEMTQRLKNLAMELSIPIILLSQLNRAVEGREDKHPILSDLRESGNIEQDADVVVFIYRDEMYNPTPANEGKAELIIAKNRFGPPGVVEVMFKKEIAHFTMLDVGW